MTTEQQEKTLTRLDYSSHTLYALEVLGHDGLAHSIHDLMRDVAGQGFETKVRLTIKDDGIKIALSLEPMEDAPPGQAALFAAQTLVQSGATLSAGGHSEQ